MQDPWADTRSTERISCYSGDVRVTVAWSQMSATDADVIHKDIHLLDLHLTAAPYHLMNGSGQYVIVLQHQTITVQTLQQQTPPSMSTVQYVYYKHLQVSNNETK